MAWIGDEIASELHAIHALGVQLHAIQAQIDSGRQYVHELNELDACVARARAGDAVALSAIATLAERHNLEWTMTKTGDALDIVIEQPRHLTEEG